MEQKNNTTLMVIAIILSIVAIYLSLKSQSYDTNYNYITREEFNREHQLVSVALQDMTKSSDDYKVCINKAIKTYASCNQQQQGVEIFSEDNCYRNLDKDLSYC